MTIKITNLRALRIRAGLSQADLAERVGVAQPVVSSWERGLDIPQDRARQLLTILGEKVDTTGVSESGLNETLK